MSEQEQSGLPNDNQPDDKGDQGTLVSKRRVIIGGLVAVAVVALLVALATMMPSGSDQGSSASDPSQEAIEATATDAEDIEPSCEHDWTVTYKTVHHDAVTHTETVDPVYGEETTYHTVCNECGQVIDGNADEHIRETGHSGYSTGVPITDEVIVTEGYTHEVTDTPAYDETVPDSLVCTLCGETRPIGSAAE